MFDAKGVKYYFEIEVEFGKTFNLDLSDSDFVNLADA